ncbi:MAG TPA: hypothetical protein VLH86_03485 [Patescibacteria group bacterium]|nr:hypothetical protein [Patescibacteria group bacterium]
MSGQEQLHLSNGGVALCARDELVAHGNQYLMAEDVPPDTLALYYNSEFHLGVNDYARGWLGIELGMHTPSRLEEAAVDMGKAWHGNLGHDTFADASFALAFMPVFADRALGQAPNRETLSTLYTELVRLMRNPRLDDGNKATAAVLALGVRRAIGYEDPSSILYPTSPREGRSRIRATNGDRFNHDCYPLHEPGHKQPVEIKLFRPSADHKYADDVFTFCVGKEVRDLIRGGEIYADRSDVVRLANRGDNCSGSLLQLVIDAFCGEGETRSRRQLLAALQFKFWSALKTHVEQYPHPGDGRLPIAEPAPAVITPPVAETTPAPAPTHQATVGEVASAVAAAMHDLPYGELHYTGDTIEGACNQIFEVAEGSEGVMGILEPLMVARQRLQDSLAALSLAHEQFTNYLVDAGVEQAIPPLV